MYQMKNSRPVVGMPAIQFHVKAKAEHVVGPIRPGFNPGLKPVEKGDK